MSGTITILTAGTTSDIRNDTAATSANTTPARDSTWT